ncbi:hypothetical protein M426DRAFT_317173 [Hypoxylon sp. CI-4A]|nr:hypothetical protein M426DRAFT_317173 [Hypoxylon sp. CI-4A]
MTNLGPLTTIFTPSGSDCTSTFIGLLTGNAWLQYGVGGAASSACLPASFEAFEDYFYSPGICPSGYTSACVAQYAPSTGTASETEATCCPTSYSCRDNRGHDPFGCFSYFDEPKTFAVSTFLFEINSAGSTTKIEAGSTTQVWSSNSIRAYGPVIRVRPGDIATTSSTSALTPTRSSIGTTTPTAPSPVGGDEASSPGLSTGAAVGIGIGCGLLALALIGAAVAVFIRRRKRRGQTELVDQPVPNYDANKPLHDNPPRAPHPYELYAGTGRSPRELTEWRFHELEARRD